MKKKALWIAGIAVLLLGGGYGVKQYVTMKIGNEVMQMAQEPDVKKAIDTALANGKGQSQINDLIQGAAKQSVTAVQQGQATDATSAGANGDSSQQDTSISKTESSSSASSTSGSTSSASTSSGSGASGKSDPSLQFNSRNDAVSYAMSKFSASEIAHYMSVYQNRSHLSKAEKAEIKSEILSRFSAQELKALQEAASK